MHPVIFKRNNYIGIRKTNHRTAHELHCDKL